MKIQQFNFTVDLMQVLLWQYNEALRLQTLIFEKQEWYNENFTQFWQDWYDNVFNLITANEFGLTVWSVILGLPLFIPSIPDDLDKPIWGFGDNNQNFGNGNFSSANSTIGLTIEQRRLILRMRYFQLTSRGAIPQTNFMLKLLFGNNSAYVLDGLRMNLLLFFTFDVDPNLLQVILDYDLIPRPAGVLLQGFNTTQPVFGFGENNKNFGNGNFAHFFYQN